METLKNPVIQTKNLIIKIKSKGTVIKYGDLDIYGGDFITLEGNNGSGKSTFLKLLNNYGDYYFVEGYIYINGKEIGDYDDAQLKRKIVNIDQEELFIRNESAYHALIRPTISAIHDLDKKKEAKNKAKEIIFGLYKDYLIDFYHKHEDSNKKDKYRNNPKSDLKFMYLQPVSKLSGGQQKMIHILQGIVKAMVTNSNIILLDEPLNNLDKDNKKILIDLINDLRAEHPDIVILLITHCRVFQNINKVLKINEGVGEYIAKIAKFDGEYHHCLE